MPRGLETCGCCARLFSVLVEGMCQGCFGGDIPDPDEQECRACGISFPLDEFPKGSSSCRECWDKMNQAPGPWERKWAGGAQAKYAVPPGIYTCRVCKIDKDETHFYKAGGTKVNRLCKSCRRVYQNERNQARREAKMREDERPVPDRGPVVLLKNLRETR